MLAGLAAAGRVQHVRAQASCTAALQRRPSTQCLSLCCLMQGYHSYVADLSLKAGELAQVLQVDRASHSAAASEVLAELNYELSMLGQVTSCCSVPPTCLWWK